ncbi:MAG: FAD:protein FMN transferase [Lachnospiraceae bacterium]|nr:FAD:protein FMN transferase [Lachnospiraceae bacterium]
MKRIYTCFLILVLLLCGGCSYGKTQNENASSSCDIFAMDTYMTLTAYGKNSDRALEEAENRINELDKKLSTGSPDSEIALLNKNGSGKLSDDTLYLLDKSLEISKETNGAFLPTIYPLMEAWGFPTKDFKVPDDSVIENCFSLFDTDLINENKKEGTVSFKKQGMKLDFGGIAKGYTSNEVIEIFKKSGIENAIINLGGNVQTLGKKPDGSLWRVAIQSPNEGDEYLGILEISDKAVITSGGYERYFEENGVTYHHIIDPKTGYPADNELVSVTIVCDDGLLADGLSTALFVMGLDEAIQFWQNHSEMFDVILMTKDNEIYVSDGISDLFSTTYEMNVIER